MLTDSINRLTTRPGVYLFRDGEGAVLYVGKAKSLRSRVQSYFRGDGPDSPRIREMVERAVDLETIVVGTESEALILEANLIKEHHPQYNILLRDDKRYPYIKVTVQEPFPRVLVTRKTPHDGSRYFGPFTGVGAVRRALKVIQRAYTVRSCRYKLPDEAPSRPCLDYHIGRCLAPCVALQTRDEYRAMIGEILSILEGDTEELRAVVEARMRDAASTLDFESAGRHKTVLDGIDAIAREQRVHRVGGGSKDLIGFARDGDRASGAVLRVRSGLLLGRRVHEFESVRDESDEAILTAIVQSEYLAGGADRRSDLPPELLLPTAIDDAPVFEAVLSEARGARLKIRVPERGEGMRLVSLARDNARSALEDRVIRDSGSREERADETLHELRDRLRLKVVPRLIACVDVSHLQGSDPVGSVVLFENAEPRKAGYRRMRIKGDWGNDDYRSIEETVRRWASRRLAEEERLPDLLVVDGGKGQLGAAMGALAEISEAGDMAVIALAKREEEVFLPDRSSPVLLDKRRRPLHLLQRIRDEAHRFGITYNRKLRSRRTLTSELAQIPGIGPGRQRALLERFGSVRDLRTASEEDIARVPGFSKALAARILTYLR